MPVDSWNTTSSSMVASSMDSSGLLMIVITIMAVVGFLLLVSSLERYTAFFRTIEWVVSSIKYALYGGGVVASLVGLYAVCSMLTTVGSGVGFRIEWLAFAVGAYVVLSALGWIVEMAVARLTSMHAQYVEQQAVVEEPAA